MAKIGEVQKVQSGIGFGINDPVMKQMFLKSMKALSGNISKSCEACGIERAQYLQWINEDSMFRFQVMVLIENIGDEVEEKLLEKIRDGDIIATIFYCKTKLKHRGYVEKSEQIQKGSGKTNVNVSVVVPIKEEENAGEPKPSDTE